MGSGVSVFGELYPKGPNMTIITATVQQMIDGFLIQGGNGTPQSEPDLFGALQVFPGCKPTETNARSQCFCIGGI